ncbi:MAG: arginine--tRNA ligase [Candidatus Omnitrophica bacterium]|nr:arginine--tRNA ligase [Candidatus Omnitrophota bacterium]
MLNKDISKKIEDRLRSSCKEYFDSNLPDISFPENMDVTIQVTKDASHGDLYSNIAMRLASVAKCAPQKLGEDIVSVFKNAMKGTIVADYIKDVELKGGFINFKLAVKYYHRVLFLINSQKDSFGRAEKDSNKHVNLEFVSANPTGPLTIAHGRQAAIGDALSRILRFSGVKVTNEYYLNNTGRQIDLLGKSVKIRYQNLFGKNESMPEDGYQGGYVTDIAEGIKKIRGDSLLDEKTYDFFREYAVNYIMKLIEDDLLDFGVKFDVWTPQTEIERENKVEAVLNALDEAGYIYENEGAKWFASTKFGDDKDRVVVKSDGAYTYLAPDIAYHLDKYKRGYTHLVDFLGPDHHGYIKRMKAAIQALGKDKSSLDILIVQLVTLLRGGETVSMSTRRGEFVSLRELIEELGKDVTRFFFLSRRLDSHLDFDIELAKRESSDNPVFYIQYAHARICSIKKYSRKNRIKLMFVRKDVKKLSSKEEMRLIRKLSEFPFAVKASAEALEPNRLIAYLNDLARCFHSFYTECRVISDDPVLSKTRLFLVECTRIVLSNGLGLLNITLPERM